MDMETSSANAMVTSALVPLEFAFITITNPKEIKDSKKQTKIRRHARESTIRAKGQRQKYQKTVVLELPESNFGNTLLDQPTDIIREAAIPISEKGRDDIEEEGDPSTPFWNFLRPIGHGRGLDPLAPFPTVVSARNRYLLDYVFLNERRDYRPLIEEWFTASMCDKSAFQLTMASAAVIYGVEAGDRQSETVESLKYYNMSLQSVNMRLQDPVDGISEGVIGTVLGFACHDHMIGNYQRANAHLNGLDIIVKLRGGMDTLYLFYHQHVLRLMIFRIDVSNSLVMDTQPRFPLPNDLVYHFTNVYHYNILDDFIAAWKASNPHLTDIAHVLVSIAKMAQYMNNAIEHIPTSLWRDEWFMVQRFMPVLHESLSLLRLDLSQPSVAPEVVMREAVRTASITLLSSINRKFHVSLARVITYKAGVMNLLTRLVSWPYFLELRLWVVFIGGLFAEDEPRAWHVAEASNTMRKLGLNTWDAACTVLKSILWVDDIMDAEAKQFGLKVEEFMRQK